MSILCILLPLHEESGLNTTSHSASYLYLKSMHYSTLIVHLAVLRMIKLRYASVKRYMWQSRVEIEGYSVAYFDRLAAFEAPYR